jgi:hypothetical protein
LKTFVAQIIHQQRNYQEPNSQVPTLSSQLNMYYINNSEMICIPFTLEHVRNIVSDVIINSGVIMGVVMSSMVVFATSTVSNILSFTKYMVADLSSEEIICIAFGITTLIFALILKINAMLLNDIFKKIVFLTKENEMKTAKIEILTRQIDSYWEKMNKHA